MILFLEELIEDLLQPYRKNFKQQWNLHIKLQLRTTVIINICQLSFGNICAETICHIAVLLTLLEGFY